MIQNIKRLHMNRLVKTKKGQTVTAEHDKKITHRFCTYFGRSDIFLNCVKTGDNMISSC